MKACVITSIVAVLVLPSIIEAAESPPIGTINPLLEIYGSAVRDATWEDKTIPVCWEEFKDEHEALRHVTRVAITSTWEAHSSIRFTGWSACEVKSKGIRIFVADQGPHVKALGKYLGGRPKGLVLNFTFVAIGCSEETIESCVKKLAVHEFGHALGLAHEHNRNDTPDACKEEVEGALDFIQGDWNITDYDPHSIMNYCHKPWLGNGQLTDKDIEAIRELYKD